MCEMVAVTVPVTEAPIDMAVILDWARLMDERGIAGYGWGMVWQQPDGVHRYRSVNGIRVDRDADRVLTRVKTHRLFVHVRRPSLMSTISQVDTQPYWDPESGLAFAHNGYLERHGDLRSRYTGQLAGRSDSEVGFWLWIEAIARGEAPAAALRAVHEQLGGQANFMTLARTGQLLVYAGNIENASYHFRIGAWTVAATGLHSHDHYLFETVFPDACGIERVEPSTVWEMP